MVAYSTAEQQTKAPICCGRCRWIPGRAAAHTPDWGTTPESAQEDSGEGQPAGVDTRPNAAARYRATTAKRFYYYSDGSIRVAGYAPTKWTAVFKGTINSLPSIGAFRFQEQLSWTELPCATRPGRSVKR